MTDIERRSTDLTYDAAVTLDERIDRWHDQGHKLAMDAYRGRIWLQLGYDSWDAYCETKRHAFAPALSRDDRREVVGEMRDAGMSTRAIGSALGVSVGTVHGDLSSGVQNRTPGETSQVTGLDGRTYDSRKPARDTTPPPPTHNPFAAPTVSVEPESVVTLPEPIQSEEDVSVLSGAVLDRPRTPEQQAVVDAAHARRVSDSLRQTLNWVVQSLGSEALREEYVTIYQDTRVAGYIAVTPENLYTAADHLRTFAQLWKERRG